MVEVVVDVEVVDVEEVEVVVVVVVVVPPLQAVKIKGTTRDNITREINNLFFILPSKTEIPRTNNQAQRCRSVRKPAAKYSPDA